MSRLVDIKHKIEQLDGGEFQNLCDAYLHCKGYGHGYSLGMKTGTDKVAKGNPDTYFITENGKYVFVIYTTQQQDFVPKTLNDLAKCFDEEKTGVQSKDIAEIICCHTYGRLTAGEDQKLHQYCDNFNVNLSMIGIDAIANDIFFRYKILAKDFLSIPLETGQIMSMETFTCRHDANKMSAPLNTEFMFRDKELESAQEYLEQSDILVITGAAGAGKTRFAIELCKELSGEKGYETLVIKNNNQAIYEDLFSSIEEEKEYLVFVDDANELTELHLVLDFLAEKQISTKHIEKIIITVRDYARQTVLEKVLEVEQPRVIKIEKFKDEEIKALIYKNFGITNPHYQERIIAIAEGNARLAVLAGKHAIDGGTLESIYDATGLYENYYHNPIIALSEGLSTLVSAGIIAFLEAIHLDYVDQLNTLFEIVKITKEQFVKDLHRLHELEIVDLCNNRAAKIADQSFGNYLIKYIFVDKEIVPLNLIVDVCLLINRSQTVLSCNILLNIFSDEDCRRRVEQQLNIVWDRLRANPERFSYFFESFHMLRPTETLLWIQECIEETEEQPFDVISLIPSKNGKSIEDKLLKLLCSFNNSTQLPEALDLLLMYYAKKPEKYEEFYAVLTTEFGFDKDSVDLNCVTQVMVVERLCSLVENNPNDNNVLLFIRVAKHFLNFSFSKTEAGRHHSMTFYTLNLPCTEEICSYRNQLWNKLLDIYSSKRFTNEIDILLEKYGEDCKTDTAKEVAQNEINNVLELCTLLNPSRLYHCHIVKQIINFAKHASIELGDRFISFTQSKKYKIFLTLYKYSDEYAHLNYKERKIKQSQNIAKMIEEYTISDYELLMQICQECVTDFDEKERLLTAGLNDMFEFVPKDIFNSVVELYLKYNTPYNIRIDKIVQRLFDMYPVEAVKKIIWSYEYEQKNCWQWSFFEEIPKEAITEAIRDELLEYLACPPLDLKHSSYRPIEELKKYDQLDSEILIKASKNILDHYQDAPFVSHLYFELSFNSESKESKILIEQFKHNMHILEDIYLKQIVYSNSTDYDGSFLEVLINQNEEFLYKYLDNLLAIEDYAYRNRDAFSKRLRKNWKREDFREYFETISDYIYYKKEEHRCIYSEIFKELLLHRENEDEIVTKQDIWIEHMIKTHNMENEYMCILFESISGLSHSRRKKALIQFISQNSSWEAFEHLPLESSSWCWSGSEISYIRNRIEFLSSLLPSLSGIKYIRHRDRIEKLIEGFEREIEEAEIRELLQYWRYS